MVLDIIVLGILALFTFWGLRTGLVRMALRMGSLVLSIVLAWMLYPYVSELISGFLFDRLYPLMQNSLAGSMDGITGGAQQLPEAWRAAAQQGADAAVGAASDAAAQGLTLLVINVVSFFGVFLLCKGIIWGVSLAMDLLTKLPVIHQCDKLVGAVLGFLEGILVVYLILALVFIAAPLRDSGEFRGQLEESRIAGRMYYNNWIVNLAAPDGDAAGGGNTNE